LTDYKSLTDPELFERLKSDDHQAYSEIYKRYNLVMLNHAHNRLRNREEAKDVVHEIFTLLWSKRANLVLSHNLAGFLYTSVRNLILNHIARTEVRGNTLILWLNIKRKVMQLQITLSVRTS
jgi:DNA-directed RNA polymerase specialized sigma24 family protein